MITRRDLDMNPAIGRARCYRGRSMYFHGTTMYVLRGDFCTRLAVSNYRGETLHLVSSRRHKNLHCNFFLLSAETFS